MHVYLLCINEISLHYLCENDKLQGRTLYPFQHKGLVHQIIDSNYFVKQPIFITIITLDAFGYMALGIFHLYKHCWSENPLGYLIIRLLKVGEGDLSLGFPHKGDQEMPLNYKVFGQKSIRFFFLTFCYFLVSWLAYILMLPFLSWNYMVLLRKIWSLLIMDELIRYNLLSQYDQSII